MSIIKYFSLFILLSSFAVMTISKDKLAIAHYSEFFFSPSDNKKDFGTRITNLRYFWPIYSSLLICIWCGLIMLFEYGDSLFILVLAVWTIIRGYWDLILFESRKIKNEDPRYMGKNIILEFLSKKIQFPFNIDDNTDQIEGGFWIVFGMILIVLSNVLSGLFFIISGASILIKWYYERNRKRLVELAIVESQLMDDWVQNKIKTKTKEESFSNNDDSPPMGEL